MRVRLAEMTETEVAAAVARGMTTLILPLGATEQHGAHLPLGTDAFRADALAEALGSALPALVAPLLPIGCSDEHTGFAGLIGIDHDTLAQIIVDCARRVQAWGVRRVVLLSAHGGNLQAMRRAQSFSRGDASAPDVLICSGPSGLIQTLREIAAADGITPEAQGAHAGEAETSEMLKLRPDLVRADRFKAGYVGPLAEVLPALRQLGIRAVSADGVLGDPRRACALRGARYLQAHVDAWCAQLRVEAGTEHTRDRPA